MKRVLTENKNRNNTEKLKATLAKHQHKLVELADKLISCEENKYIIQQGRIVGRALHQYFNKGILNGLCEAIKPSILF